MFELLLQKLFKYEHIDHGYDDGWLLFDVTMNTSDDTGNTVPVKVDYVKIAADETNNLTAYLYNDVEDFMDCYESETEYYRKFELNISLTVSNRED